jgi:prepilin-type N-terminal cleavage/methylation domain-containing protein
MPHTNQKGFTLIEISIVLTIIALIIGGIIVSRDLIRVSELNSVTSDVARYRQAFTDFRDKYLALPGDFSGAEALWGSDSNCPNTATNTTPKTATCNGNGDGHVGYYNITPFAVSNFYEVYRAWQQLADAGFIDGSYSGVAAPASNSTYGGIPGVNIPASRIPGAGYTVYYVTALTTVVSTDWISNYGHDMGFGATEPAWTAVTPVLTPTEAAGIDQKIDDGLPGYGNVMTGKNYTNCNTSTTQASAGYNTSYTGIACSLQFLMGF